MSNETVQLQVHIPFGSGTRVISKTIRPLCYEDEGCTYTMIEEEGLQSLKILIHTVGYVA